MPLEVFGSTMKAQHPVGGCEKGVDYLNNNSLTIDLVNIRGWGKSNLKVNSL